jgi:hypothetical protein
MTEHPANDGADQFGPLRQNDPSPPAAALESRLVSLLSLPHPMRREDLVDALRLSWHLPTAGRDEEWKDIDDAELSALLAQYDTLRQESLNAISNRPQVLLVGVAAVGALWSAPITIENDVLRAQTVPLVYSMIVPLTILLLLVVWIGEAARINRVHRFMASDVEAKINRKLGRMVVTWETSLRVGLMPRDEFAGPTFIVTAVLTLLSWSSPLIGLLMTDRTWHWTGWPPIWDLWIGWTVSAALVWYLISSAPNVASAHTVRPLFEEPHKSDGFIVRHLRAYIFRAQANQANPRR